LVNLSPDDPEVQKSRQDMLVHPKVRDLIDASSFENIPIQRHNDASHPIYKLSTLADFGLRMDDPGISPLLAKILARQSSQGAFQSLVNIPRA
jgi:hypothetical protein